MGIIVYGDEVVSVDRDTGKKQLYVILTNLRVQWLVATFRCRSL